jgi:phage terminase large subunit-like protein
LSKFKHCKAALKYAQLLVSGAIPACKWVRLACQRHLDDLAHSKERTYPYKFDKKKAEKVCRFIEKLVHIKGKWAGQPIRLEPWQSFFITTVFGWVRKKDGYRRFREAYLEVPRKNAKSTIAAGIGLYMFAADGEDGSEVYSGATTEKQAWEVFRPARLMARKDAEFQEHFGVTINASNLAIENSACKFEPLIGNPGDGASPHCSITDEFHEHKSPEQYDTMITGMGARTQPLALIITTAGGNLAGPCYDKRMQICKVLEKVFDNDEIFGLIYTLDEAVKGENGEITVPEDDWTDFKNWKKANPNFGVSVFEDFLRARHREALQRASRQNIIRCKHLNQWMNADVVWMNMADWRKCIDPSLKIEKFLGKPCWVALDLASKIDIAAMAILFKYEDDQGEDHYACFWRFYLPEEQAEPEDRSHYAGWAKEGWITLTDGNVIDYSYIEEDLLDLSKEYEVQEVPYDPFQATQFATRMGDEGLTMVEIGATVKNFSEPMKEFEKLVLSGRFHHDGNPVMTWMVSNVVAHTDKKDNIFPNKERSEAKIDGPVATIMGLSRAIHGDGMATQLFVDTR